MNKMFLFICSTLAAFLLSFSLVSAGTEHNLEGFAWSSNIGWISFNSTNDHDPSTPGVQQSAVNYGVTMDGNGDLNGFAWSSNIGWIQFGGLDMVGFPSGAGTQPIDAKVTGNQLRGWARAYSIDTLNAATQDSWDGWISLAGVVGNGPSIYGVNKDNDGNFSGMAWGDQVIGWIDFNGVSVNESDLSLTLSADPTGVREGSTVEVTSILTEGFNGQNLTHHGLQQRLVTESTASWSTPGVNDVESWVPESSAEQSVSVDFNTAGTYELRAYAKSSDIPDYIYSASVRIDVSKGGGEPTDYCLDTVTGNPSGIQSQQWLVDNEMFIENGTGLCKPIEVVVCTPPAVLENGVCVTHEPGFTIDAVPNEIGVTLLQGASVGESSISIVGVSQFPPSFAEPVTISISNPLPEIDGITFLYSFDGGAYSENPQITITNSGNNYAGKSFRIKVQKAVGADPLPSEMELTLQGSANGVGPDYTTITLTPDLFNPRYEAE